jgi:flagellar biosynthesis/type III secretory pathway chaperone
MQSLFAELATALRQEIDQYRRLIAVVRKERGRIVRGELAGLAELVHKKEAITRELAQLGASRLSILERLAREGGEDGSRMTLAHVVSMAPGEIAETLQALLIEFRGAVGLLMAANDVNRTLLDRSLDFVHGSLALFRTVATSGPTYNAGGRFGEDARPFVAVNQTA